MWGKNIISFTCGGSKIYNLKLNAAAKKLKELRLGDNPLPDLNFLKEIDSLDNLVIGRNNVFTTLDLTHPRLAKFDLSYTATLENINFNCPRLYELRISSVPSLKAVDLSKATGIKTVNLASMASLESVNFGKAENLQKVQMSADPSMKNLSFENFPSLSEISIMNLVNLGSFKLANLPKLSKLALKTSGAQATTTLLTDLNLENLPSLAQVELDQLPTLKNLKLANLPMLNSLSLTNLQFQEFNVPNLPKLSTLTYSNNPNTDKVTFDCTSLTIVSIANLVKLKEIDLSEQKGLTRVAITGCGLEKLKFDPVTWPEKVTNLTVANNHLTFPNLPYKPKKFTTMDTNYYAPQAQLPAVPATVDTDYIFDYSDWQTGDNGEMKANTEYKCITKFEEELKQGVDFKVTDGKVQFLKEIEDPVFIQLVNAAFPKFERTVDPKGKVTDYRVMTNLFKVTASQSGIEDLSKEVADGVKVQGRVFMADGKKIVTVFDAQGRKVGVGNAVEVKSPGLYIAKCGKKAVKAVVK